VKGGVRILVILTFGVAALAQVRLPDSRKLAGPLDSEFSAFGDEFFNFPPEFQGRAQPGSTYLTGWLAFEFDEPEGGYARFRMHWDAVGTPDGIAFPGGQTYQLLDNRAFSNPDFVSGGRVNLQSGEIDRLEIHALFQNSVIARVTRNIRIPFGFINDYPPVSLPVPLPFSDRPPVFSEAAFRIATDGTVTGFEFRGATLAPVTLFPRLGLFPPFAFGEDQRFYFANPDGCVPGTPPDRCHPEESHPDGVRLPSNAFFHPHLELLTRELRESPTIEAPLSCVPVPVAGVAGAIQLQERIVLVGGGETRQGHGVVRALNPATGHWENWARLPVPVTAAQAAGLGTQIFVVGGLSVDEGVPVDRLQVLDLETGHWSQKAPVPTPVHSGAAVRLDSQIFLIGGWEVNPSGMTVPSRKLQIYDPARDSWSSGAVLPTSGTSAAVTVAGGRVFVIGGSDGSGAATDSVWIYDPAANSWEAGPALDRPVLGGAACGLDGRVYLLGGRSAAEGPTLSLLQVLGVDQGEWRIGPPPPLSISEAVAAAFGGKAYFFGGRSRTGPDASPGQVQDIVQGYDPSSGWTVCSSRPVFSADGILSAACGAAGPAELSPGARMVILGHHLAGTTRSASRIRTIGGLFTTDYPLELEGVRIRLDGHPAPLISVSPGIVEFQVPWVLGVAPREGGMVSLEVHREGSTNVAPSVELQLVSAAPAMYVHSYGEYRDLNYLTGASAQARNQDGTVNHPGNPANPGTVVTVYLTGLGRLEATLEDGQRLPAGAPAAVIADVTAEVGGLPATVEWAGAVPLELGIFEVRIRIPESVSPGNNVSVRVAAAGITSNLARIAIR
jgi:uncharacterized protein (TIGR03437 family)